MSFPKFRGAFFAYYARFPGTFPIQKFLVNFVRAVGGTKTIENRRELLVVRHRAPLKGDIATTLPYLLKKERCLFCRFHPVDV